MSANNPLPVLPTATAVADAARIWAAEYAVGYPVWDEWDRATVAALESATYAVTGPRSLTVTCDARAVRRAVGKPILTADSVARATAAMILDAGTESVLHYGADAHITVPDDGESATLTW
jgi:hypothetical protein